jgi:hypothetical protein
MGRAKRYPSIAIGEDDGFREALNPSYELAANVTKAISQHQTANDRTNTNQPAPQKRSTTYGGIGEAELNETAPKLSVVFAELAASLGDLDQIRIGHLDTSCLSVSLVLDHAGPGQTRNAPPRMRATSDRQPQQRTSFLQIKVGRMLKSCQILLVESIR